MCKKQFFLSVILILGFICLLIYQLINMTVYESSYYHDRLNHYQNGTLITLSDSKQVSVEIDDLFEQQEYYILTYQCSGIMDKNTLDCIVDNLVTICRLDHNAILDKIINCSIGQTVIVIDKIPLECVSEVKDCIKNFSSFYLVRTI